MSAPSACTAKTVQDFTAAPFINTVQAPQYVVSHPTCVPVSSRSSRMNSTSKSRGSTSRECNLPLTRTWMETHSPASGINVANLHLLSAGPLERGFRRTLNKRPHELPLVFRRAPHIRLRFGGGARRIRCRVDELRCDLLAAKRCFSFSNPNRQ